jgi:predicted alpha/beta hydrolase
LGGRERRGKSRWSTQGWTTFSSTTSPSPLRTDICWGRRCSCPAPPRKIYRGFAGYLARRGYAALTYDRGTGDSRPKSLVGYKQPKSLVGFNASMADWAALDVTAAVAWMRERYKTLPLNYIDHSFSGQALGLLANNAEISRALLIAAQAGYWKLIAAPERYRLYAMLNFVGTPPLARLRAGLERPG